MLNSLQPSVDQSAMCLLEDAKYSVKHYRSIFLGNPAPVHRSSHNVFCNVRLSGQTYP